LVLVLGGVYLAASGFFDKGSQLPGPGKQLTPAEIAAKMLPELNKDMHIETNKDLQVLDVVIRQTGGSKISGSVRNTTGHVIEDAEVVFELTDVRGSRVGAVSCKFARLEPKSTTPFDNSIPQADATYAIVRDVRTQ